MYKLFLSFFRSAVAKRKAKKTTKLTIVHDGYVIRTDLNESNCSDKQSDENECYRSGLTETRPDKQLHRTM